MLLQCVGGDTLHFLDVGEIALADDESRDTSDDTSGNAARERVAVVKEMQQEHRQQWGCHGDAGYKAQGHCPAQPYDFSDGVGQCECAEVYALGLTP